MTAVQQGETTVSFPQWDEIISEGEFVFLINRVFLNFLTVFRQLFDS